MTPIPRSKALPAAESLARARLAADEARSRSRPGGRPSLGETFAAFWRHPSPWLITVTLATLVETRLFVGNWRASDLLAPAVLVILFPLLEWVVHVFVLHWRPRAVGGILIDTQLARKHRLHHGDPRDLPLVFIPWQSLIAVIVVYNTVALLAFPRLGMALTFMVSVALLGLGYEWTHYLVHSDYTPRSRPYRAVWRNHRLHHYKNEHYWFSVTTCGTSDRVLGTYPDPGTVPTSPTAKNLHADV